MTKIRGVDSNLQDLPGEINRCKMVKSVIGVGCSQRPSPMRGYNENGELLLGRDASDGNPIYNIDKYKEKTKMINSL